MIQMYLQNRKRLTDLENKFMVAGEVGEGVVREVGMGMDTLLCLTWMSSEEGALLSGVWRLDRMEFRGGWTRVHVWPMPFPAHLERSQRCESANPIQKEKVKKQQQKPGF